MTNFKITLIKCDRDQQFKEEREAMFKKFMLDKFETPENAISMRDRFYDLSRPRGHIYAKHIRDAFNYATKHVGRKESKDWVFVVGLE